MRNQIINALKVSLLAVILSFGLSYALAWTAPSVAPTGGNVAAPINTGSTAQTKAGGIIAGSFITAGTISGWNFVANSVTFTDGTMQTTSGGSQTFTTNGIFHVPQGLQSVYVSGTAGGGGGGNGWGAMQNGGGGGGGAESIVKQRISVTPGASYTITIGSGGCGGCVGHGSGGNGTNTVFQGILTLHGGYGGIGYDTGSTGGAGGGIGLSTPGNGSWVGGYSQGPGGQIPAQVYNAVPGGNGGTAGGYAGAGGGASLYGTGGYGGPDGSAGGVGTGYGGGGGGGGLTHVGGSGRPGVLFVEW